MKQPLLRKMPNRNRPLIHQIHYRLDQRPHLDPLFHAYDNSVASGHHRFEFGVFMREYRNLLFDSYTHTGFLSWKFNEKTGITGRQFLDFIESHPGGDVYFINPFPNQALERSVWLQGERHHPGLISLTQELLNESGYRFDLQSLRMPYHLSAYCNYWVGNRKFWDGYIRFIRPLFQFVDTGLSERQKTRLFAQADDKIDANYLPFIFERMFSTYLVSPEGRGDKPIHYRYSREELSTKVMEKELGLILMLQKKIPRPLSEVISLSGLF